MVDAADLALHADGALLAGAYFLLGLLLVQVIAIQAEDIGQNLLALGRGLDRERIGAALQQERGVGESVVLHAQRADDQGLPLVDAALVEQLPVLAALVPDVQVQVGLAAAPLAALAPDAVTLRAQAELQVHPHLGLAQRDEFVIAARAGPAPERPGHRVQQRGLAVAVVARETGEVNAGEIEALFLAIAHEVVEFEFMGNHDSVSARYSALLSATPAYARTSRFSLEPRRSSAMSRS